MKNHKRIIGIVITVLGAAFSWLFVSETLVPYAHEAQFLSRLESSFQTDPLALADASAAYYRPSWVRQEIVFFLLNYLYFAHYQTVSGLTADQNELMRRTYDMAQSDIAGRTPNAQYDLYLGRAADALADIYPHDAASYHAQAETYFAGAQKLYPGNQTIQYAYAMHLDAEGNHAAALAVVQKIDAADDRIPATRYYLGLLELDGNSPDLHAALANFERAFNGPYDAESPFPARTLQAYQKVFLPAFDHQETKADFMTTINRLKYLDPDQRALYQKILDYITTNGTVPTVSVGA